MKEVSLMMKLKYLLSLVILAILLLGVGDAKIKISSDEDGLNITSDSPIYHWNVANNVVVFSTNATLVGSSKAPLRNTTSELIINDFVEARWFGSSTVAIRINKPFNVTDILAIRW
ncbi:MAG: hypothetical protein WCX69_03315 [Candidatus Paceibacterota bacterium]